MPTFLFREKRSPGISGFLTADSGAKAKKELSSLRIDLDKIVEVPRFLAPIMTLVASGAPPKREVSRFLRNLEMLYSSGIPLVECLVKLSQEGWHPLVAMGAQRTLKRLEAGDSLSEGLASVHGFLPVSCISLIASGEKSGRLSESLKAAAEIQAAEYETGQRVRSALVYPCFTVGVFLLAFFLLFVFVLPRFADVFVGLRVDIPLLVRLGLTAAGFLGDPLVLLCLFQLMAAVLLLGRRWLLTRQGKRALYLVSAGIPPVRNFLLQNFYADFCFNLSTLIGSGVSVSEAVMLCAKTCPHPEIVEAIERANERLMNGESLAESLQSEGFPSMMCQLISVGEEVGQFETSFAYLRKLYADQTQAVVDRFLSLLEPALIIFMGLSVGAFLLSAMLPLVNVLSNLGGS